MTVRPHRAVSRVFLNIAAVVVIVASLFPVYWMLNTSLLPASAVRTTTPHWWPDEFTLSNYQEALGDQSLVTALLNSLSVTGITLVVALAFAFLGAIAVSRYRFRTRTAFIIAILVIQMIPVEAMIISLFRLLDGWYLLNTIIGADRSRECKCRSEAKQTA